MKKRPINLAFNDQLRNQLTDGNFKVFTNVDESEVSLLIMHGFVGDSYDENDSASVEAFLAEHSDKSVVVSINSPGGLAFDGIAIFNALARHPKPTKAVITGMAASAASIISQGADRVEMYDNATFMVHNAIGLSWGNRHAMEETSEVLEMVDQQIAVSLAARTGESVEDVAALMDGKGKRDGTWMSAEEAKVFGFVDEVLKTEGEGDNNGNGASPQNRKQVATTPKAQANQNWANEVEVRMRLLQV